MILKHIEKLSDKEITFLCENISRDLEVSDTDYGGKENVFTTCIEVLFADKNKNSIEILSQRTNIPTKHEKVFEYLKTWLQTNVLKSLFAQDIVLDHDIRHCRSFPSNDIVGYLIHLDLSETTILALYDEYAKRQVLSLVKKILNEHTNEITIDKIRLPEFFEKTMKNAKVKEFFETTAEYAATLIQKAIYETTEPDEEDLSHAICEELYKAGLSITLQKNYKKLH